MNMQPIWPGWETVRLIGRGSFGAVYEIERDMLGEKEKAALKVITIPQSSSDIEELYGEGYDDKSITNTFKEYLKSIVAEYTLMRKLNGSSNVVSCDDVRYVQHDDGIGWDIFIKMELLTPLTKALGKTVTDEQAVRIGSDICKALVLCKKHNIIHRDIKPANIFVSENGDYKLGDFGIAKTVEKTSGGTKIGTYEYMAPEVYHDRPYGSAADIYSLGMVLYWVLNERRTPFLKMPPALPGNSEKELARKRRFGGEAIPAPAHGSAELQRIVLKACAFDPAERYQSAEDMLADLRVLDNGVAAESEEKTVAPGMIPVASDVSETGEETTVGVKGPEEETERVLPEKEREEEGSTVGAFDGGSKEPKKEPGEEPNEEPKKEPEEKRRILPIILGAAAVLAILIAGFFTVHIWKPATCTEAETCRICGKTRGEALGHHFTEATCTSPRICTVCGATDGAALGHSWAAATCTAPKTCKVCGATEGEALGHSWEAATCTAPKTCKVCGATEGTATGHSWTEATSTTPKICKVCGEADVNEIKSSTAEDTQPLSKVTLTLDRLPVVTANILDSNFSVSSNHAHLLSISWSNSSGYIDKGGKFDQDTYDVKITVEADEGYHFVSDLHAYINLSEASVSVSDNGLYAYVYREFEPLIYKPMLFLSPHDELVEAGSFATFTSSAQYYESVVWVFTAPNGTDEIDSSAFESLFPGCKCIGADSETLTIANVSVEMNGWLVKARFQGALGLTTYSNGAKLTVVEKG